MIDKDALWQAYLQAPTTQNRNAVAEAYLYLAQAVARRFAGRGVETQDLTRNRALRRGQGPQIYHLRRADDRGRGAQLSAR